MPPEPVARHAMWGLVAFVVTIILCVVNVSYCLLGLAITALGIVLQWFAYDIEVTLFRGEYTLGPVIIVTVVIGIIIFTVGLTGACGTCTKNKWLLLIYSISMVLLASGTIFIVVSTTSSANKELVMNITTESLHTLFNSTSTLFDTFGVLETSYQCCGLSGPSDYAELPLTCCPVDYIQLKCTATNAYQNGCLATINDMIVAAFEGVGALAVATIVSEYVFAALGFLLYYCVRHKEKIK